MLIVSGLFGVVAPPDPIPHYKLKMSAALPGTGRLSTWWRPRLTAALAEQLRGRVVWDLLPQEHSAAHGARNSNLMPCPGEPHRAAHETPFDARTRN